MALTYAIDARRNDIAVGKNGKLLTVYGAEEVRQRVLVALQHYYQEYFLNVPTGMPWHELLLGSKDKKLVEALVRRTILDVPNVISIISLETIYPAENRGLALYASIEVFGEAGPETIEIINNIMGG